MSNDQEKQLNEFYQGIDDQGAPVPGTRGLLFKALDNLEKIEAELNRKDRTSKKELRILLADTRRELFEALKGIRG